MNKSSLKNYIAFLEAKDEIAELKADAAKVQQARNYWMRQHELKGKELLKAKDEIAELKRRLDANSWICALRANLTGETCEETRARLREDNERLREDNERLSRLLRLHQTQPSFERDHNDTQA